MSSYIKYRPDIDGLRALAVLAVVIFHINDQWLPGGFLGVDLFFVISGFLITSIIKRQVFDDKFSFLQFYAKRIKRILPLFFFVLFCTVIASMILLLPEDYDRFWRSARYAMQFRANRAFLGEDYFDVGVEEKPLLHMWSLAIEEQFYFIWPLLFVVIYLVVKKTQRPLFWLYCGSVIGIIVSIAFAQYSIKVRPDESYFLLRNRAAELLIGCALALSPFNFSAKVRQYLGVTGLIILIVSIVLYRPEISIPGFYLLLPTIGAMLYLQDNDCSSRYKSLLSCSVLRWIGLLSFSIYLWHWPILAFIRYIEQDSQLSQNTIVLAICLTIALSLLSYFFVENPLRRLKWGFLKSFILFYILPFAIISGVNFAYTHYYQKQEVHFFEERAGCFDKITANCSVGAMNAPQQYLLIGDSHAMHLSEMVDYIGKRENVEITIISAGGCRVAFNAEIDANRHPACKEVNDYLKSHWQEYDVIMFSFYAYLHLSSEVIDPNYLDQLVDTVKEIAQYKPLIFFLDIPSKGYNPRRYLKHNAMGLIDNTIEGRITDNHHIANQLLSERLANIPNVRLIEIAPYVEKATNDLKQNVYFDHHHLSSEGSTLIGELFIERNSLKER